jgi:hypothetical protein
VTIWRWQNLQQICWRTWWNYYFCESLICKSTFFHTWPCTWILQQYSEILVGVAVCFAKCYLDNPSKVAFENITASHLHPTFIGKWYWKLLSFCEKSLWTPNLSLECYSLDWTSKVTYCLQGFGVLCSGRQERMFWRNVLTQSLIYWYPYTKLPSGTSPWEEEWKTGPFKLPGSNSESL